MQQNDRLADGSWNPMPLSGFCCCTHHSAPAISTEAAPSSYAPPETPNQHIRLAAVA